MLYQKYLSFSNTYVCDYAKVANIIVWRTEIYEKSLHAHRFAKRHVRKHPSVSLNVIDGENISRAPGRDFIFVPLFQSPYILPLKTNRESTDERRKKAGR